MIGKPPPSPGGAPRNRDLIALRIANLRRELEAETESETKAAILYEMGALHEHELGELASAVDLYGQAHATEPGFQPALIAQLRIAERPGGAHDVATLRSRQVATARSPAISAGALLDLALHSEDWVSLLREAIARAPEPAVPGLILEWLAEARGDANAVRFALRCQAQHAKHPELRAALWIDTALSELDAGHTDEAVEALEQAAESEALAWQARSLQLRIAREHERWDDVVRAAVEMATLLEAAEAGNGSADPLDLPVAIDERVPMAAFLWRQAAQYSQSKLEDADAATRYLRSAIRLVPDDRVVRVDALLTGAGGADEISFDTSAWFETTAPDDPAFVAHQVRRALSSDDAESAIELLRETAARHPASTYARSALDVGLIRGGARKQQAARLRDDAGKAIGETEALYRWHAAQLMTSTEAVNGETQALFEEAIDTTTDSIPRIVREAMGAALLERNGLALLERCDQLLGLGVEQAEQTMLWLTKYAAQATSGPNKETQKLLEGALDDPAHDSWAAHLGRALGAWTDNPELLALAHERLAERTSGATRVGHLCAAGQAHARRHDWDAAERALRQALTLAPEDRYVIALLDGVLREGGRPEDVVSLARERAEVEETSALGELSLLLAGATAERKGNPTAARHAYEQALIEAPESASAALALLDLARTRNDEQTALRAYSHLSECDLGGGVPALFALLRGDVLGSGSAKGADAGSSYARALEDPNTALPAAVSILSIPTTFTSAEQRSYAEEILAEADVTPSDGVREFTAAYAGLRQGLGEGGVSSAGAWLDLAGVAPNEGLRASTLVQGLRALRVARGVDAADEIFMLAQEADGLADAHADAAIAIDEALAPSDDAEIRADAIARKLRHDDGGRRTSLDDAYCRALVEAERGEEAFSLLIAAVDERPDDLALWETMRRAARQGGQWPMVAQACERLAPFVAGSLKADLLEEAAIVRLDCLEQYELAEDLFRRALDSDPTRDIAFHRLHDLLAEREDAAALDELVSTRLSVGGPKDRGDLLYERARLLRGFSDRPGALEVLDELFDAEPEHVGALALAAEVHVSLERWSDAVDCLRRLASAGIPDEQRRIAHLGAADFLETRLDAQPEALEELRAVEALGLADARTWFRIGSLEESAGRAEAAAEAYRHVVDAVPTNRDAVSRLVDLSEGEERESHIEAYEQALSASIRRGDLDAEVLDSLREAATWRGHEERASAAHELQRALRLNGPEEHQGPHDFKNVSMAAVWDPTANTVLQEIVKRAGPELSTDRHRAKKVTAEAPVYGELERLSRRFGARAGSVGLSESVASVTARLGRDGEIDWIAPRGARDGLEARGRFIAGRLAWATPHGAAKLVEGSAQRAAGLLSAVLRAARCEVEKGGPVLPSEAVKLKRATRKAVHEAVGTTRVDSTALLELSRSLQASADRAGLLASGDIHAALSVLLSDQVDVETLSVSERGLDLIAFWLGADSPLWGHDV